MKVAGFDRRRATLRSLDGSGAGRGRVGRTVTCSRRPATWSRRSCGRSWSARPTPASSRSRRLSGLGTRIVQDKGTVRHYCPTSPAPRAFAEFQHFVGRGGMDMRARATTVLIAPPPARPREDRADLYRLTVDDLESLERFAPSAEVLVRPRSRRCETPPLDQVLDGRRSTRSADDGDRPRPLGHRQVPRPDARAGWRGSGSPPPRGGRPADSRRSRASADRLAGAHPLVHGRRRPACSTSWPRSASSLNPPRSRQRRFVGRSRG